jgi:anti-sigma B factor antagonist
MSFTVDRRGDTLVVGTPRTLLVDNRQQMKELVLAELSKGERKFLVDLSRTEFIDSSGLGVLVTLLKAVRRENGELRVANLNADLEELFELTKLNAVFGRDERGDGGAGRVAPRVPRPPGSIFGSEQIKRPDSEVRS